MDAGHRHVRVGDIEYWVSGHQRGRVAVRAETEVDKIEHGRRAGESPREPWHTASAAASRSLAFHRHGMDLLRAQRSMLKQAFAQVSEIAIRVSIGGHTLIDLKDVHAGPWDSSAASARNMIHGV